MVPDNDDILQKLPHASDILIITLRNFLPPHVRQELLHKKADDHDQVMFNENIQQQCRAVLCFISRTDWLRLN